MRLKDGGTEEEQEEEEASTTKIIRGTGRMPLNHSCDSVEPVWISLGKSMPHCHWYSIPYQLPWTAGGEVVGGGKGEYVGYWRQRQCDVDLGTSNRHPQMASEATTPRPLFESEIVIAS